MRTDQASFDPFCAALALFPHMAVTTTSECEIFRCSDSKVSTPTMPVTLVRNTISQGDLFHPAFGEFVARRYGHVLADRLEVRLLSGRVLANVSPEANNAHESEEIYVWYTRNFLDQISSLLDVDPDHFILLTPKGRVISDRDCILDVGYLTIFIQQ